MNKLLTKAALVLAGLAIVYLSVVDVSLSRSKKAAEAAKDEAFAAKAAGEGWFRAHEASQKGIIESITREKLGLGAEIERLRRSDPSIRPISHEKTTVSIKDEAKGVVLESKNDCPTQLQDEYGRFTVSVPQKPGESALFKRQQLFVFDAVVLKRLSGSYEYVKSELREYRPGSDPSAATEIPLTGVSAKTHLDIVTENAPAIRPLHLRAVVAFDHTAAVGGGVEFFNYKDRASLSVLGLYDRKAGKGDLALALGYRLKFPALSTNLSVGPLYYPLTKKVGAGITLEVTR